MYTLLCRDVILHRRLCQGGCWDNLCSVQVNNFDLDLKHMKPAAKLLPQIHMPHNSELKLNLLLKS